MSSAALQTSPHQQTLLASPALQSPSSRQYTSHPSPNREAYQAHQGSTAPSSSRRPPSRKTSGNTNTPPFDPNTLIARTAVPGATRYSEHPPSASERSSNTAPIAPPRTSSNHQGGHTRRNSYSTEKMSNSPRHVQTDPPRSVPRGDTNGTTENGRSKRAPSSHGAQDSPARATGARAGTMAETTMPIRTQQTPNSKSSREASENLNRALANGEQTNGHHDSRDTYQGSPSQNHVASATPPAVAMNSGQDAQRGSRSRHDHSRGHKTTTKFGDFILGNTIGEGEFGKVKLGWKQDSSVQVAIKLIKRDSVGTNPSRLAKIRREVTILRGIHHPNIVRLIDMVETDRYIGIILEYASGGELFDYILNHRYLKDHSARRLFSQLVSGVGYLHKKGIVHRDLKLENLLLDRNRNIIITDFGFANTFDAHDELTEEEELKLGDRDQVKRMGLDKVRSTGMRKGDLMQTSCGSPCYAAPELVVSDSLYTGRKVDVWSCGVILYAMLAGYLPFDDDPANPEGDNINLLYKYIVSTPLTFPEYVTPHARDLLRRILVPNPRKRADLFEVARHSWLSEYSHVVEFITSSTTTPTEAQNASNTAGEYVEPPMVTRSASVRETPKQKSPQPTSVGGLAKAHGKIDTASEPAQRTPKDAKRRTVQVEYVAPITQTQRGTDDVSRAQAPHSSRNHEEAKETSPRDKPLPRDPQVSRPPQSKRPPQSSQPHAQAGRPQRETRAISDNAYITSSTTGTARPHTGGSMQSSASLGLQSRGNYGQPAPPTVADTNVQGRIQQPTNADNDEAIGRTSMSVPPKFARMSGFNEGRASEGRGHKRSSTIGEIGSKILGRSGSVFGRSRKKSEQPQMGEKSKKYPPISMSNAMPGAMPGATPATTGAEEPGPRASMESKTSRRSFSLGLGKKRSGSMTGSQGSTEKKEKRRFSLLPASFSLKNVGLSKEYSNGADSRTESQQDLPIQHPRIDQQRSFTAHGDARGSTPFFDDLPHTPQQETARSSPAYHHQRYKSVQMDGNRKPYAVHPDLHPGAHLNSGSETSGDMRRPPTEPQLGSYPHGFVDSESYDGQPPGSSRSQHAVLQKHHKRFTDAYDQDNYRGHEGSSGAAKRVMDFFRRRGKARGGDEQER